MNWKEQYPKSKRPDVSDVESYLSRESLEFYREFTSALKNKLNLSYIKPKYSASKGWGFEIGRSGLIMIKDISFENNQFYVNGTEVASNKHLHELLVWAEETYNKNFIQKFNEFSAERAEKQKYREERRKKRERDAAEALRDKIVQAKFNVYRWSPVVQREKLKRLYESDVKGMLDGELLDDIGCTIYARCLQAREERVLMDTGKVKCHNCSKILEYDPGLIACDCGYQYLYKEYRRSFRTNNMPTGGAAHIFNRFIDEWPRMRSEAEKLRLIDWLIHEFHINLLSGAKGRFVGINLIQGTKAQVKELILNLAYGDASTVSEANRKYYESHI
jgi:DNA-directed RNA polymerase subunit RPC12/RpoP